MMMVQLPGMLPAAIAAGLLSLAIPAAASSIVIADAASPPSSIVVRGEPVANPVEAREGGDSVYHIGRSIVAFGADAIPRSSEPVASIEDARRPGTFDADAVPMVMRGGIVGDAFARPAAQPQVASEAPVEPQAPAAPQSAPAAAKPSVPAAPAAEAPAAPTLEPR